jgi:biopolymer transport protein ExbB
MTGTDLLDLLFRGGPVVAILGLWSVLGLAIALERWIYLLRQGRIPARLEPDLLDPGSAPLARPLAAVVTAMEAAARAGVRDLAAVGTRVRGAELARLDSGLRSLGLLANTAPLLGLFGTITGMIKAFMVIEQAGGKVDAQALAGGIWEAMITTGVGLAVAIPLLILLHLLESMVERRAQAMQGCAALVLERLGRDAGEPPPKPAPEPAPPHWEGLTDDA